MEILIIIMGGLIGSYLFSKKDNNKPKDRYLNDFWYKYNNPIYKKNIRYNNHCWNCHNKIDSFYEKRCSICGWYICSNCSACSNMPNCEEKRQI